MHGEGLALHEKGGALKRHLRPSEGRASQAAPQPLFNTRDIVLKRISLTFLIFTQTDHDNAAAHILKPDLLGYQRRPQVHGLQELLYLHLEKIC